MLGDPSGIRWVDGREFQGGHHAQYKPIEGGHEASGELLYVIQTQIHEEHGGVQPGKIAFGGEYPGARVVYGDGEREVEVSPYLIAI